MRGERGVVLLVVLWILVVLMVLTLQLSRSMRLEGMTADTFQQEVQAYYLALAGLNRALYYILVAEAQGRTLLSLYSNVDGEPRPADAWLRADGTWYGERWGEGGYRVRVSDEEAKINLNQVDEITLRQVFLNLGFEQEDAEALTDAIFDWRDPDHLERLKGAERDYYLSLPTPYPAKDGPFDSVDELLLVRGITRRLFFGEEGPALRELFTVYGRWQRQVNLLTASPLLLQAVLGLDADLARELVQRRAEVGSGELMALLPPGTAARVGSRLPHVLAVESEGFLSRDAPVRRVRAVVQKAPGSLPRFLHWQDWQPLSGSG